MAIINKLCAKLKEYISPEYVFSPQGNYFEVNNWQLSRFIVKKLVPIVGTHPFPLNELSLMTAAVSWTSPTHIFEWGTHVGKSARIFHETARFLNIDTEIHSVDLPDQIQHTEHPGNIRGKLVKGKRGVFLHQGDGIETSLSIYKSTLMTNKNIIPLFYVDGDHEYESVFRELKLIIDNVEHIRIILHDTFWQSSEAKYNVGPAKAIKDILKIYSDKNIQVVKTDTGLPGMTFLYNA